jgi:hypothetical protein
MKEENLNGRDHLGDNIKTELQRIGCNRVELGTFIWLRRVFRGYI